MMASNPPSSTASILARASLRASLANPGMDVQRAAAALSGGHNHLAAVLLQHAHRGLVQPRERDIGDAARHQRHAVAPLAFGGKRLADLAEEEWRLRGRRQAAPGVPACPTASTSPIRAPLSASRSPDTGTRIAPAALIQSAAIAAVSRRRNAARARVDQRPRHAGSRSPRARLPPAGRTARPMGTRVSQARQARHSSICSMYDGLDRRAVRPPAPSDRCARAANPSRRPARDRSGRRSDTGRNARSDRGPPVAVCQRRRKSRPRFKR